MNSEKSLISEIRDNPLPAISFSILIFVFYFFLYMVSYLDLGYYSIVIDVVSRIFFSPISLLLGVFGLDYYFWNVWKQVPISAHALISIVYLFVLGMTLPIIFNLAKSNYYEKSK